MCDCLIVLKRNNFLSRRLYNDVGYLLDDKFRVAYNLTYYTIAGRTNVDTSKFRRAIWNYIQCIYGIRHDDYDYAEVNQVCYDQDINIMSFLSLLANSSI